MPARGFDRPCRLRQRGPGRQKVVHEYYPFGRKQPLTTGHHLQRTRQIRLPLPGAEPRLIGHRAPLPQHRSHSGRNPATPQLARCGQRDPACRIMPPRRNGPPRRRHGYEQQRPRTAHLPRPGPHGARQRPAERPRQRKRATLLVCQERRPYRVLVRGGGMHHRQPGGLRRGPHPLRRSAVQRRPTLLAQLAPRPAAATTGRRQHQPGDLPPPPPHISTVPPAHEPGHPCGKRRPPRPSPAVRPPARPQPG